MISPLPDADESASTRFRRFARALLAVPKTEIETPEQIVARLQAEKRKLEAQIQQVEAEIKKRKSPQE
jgi:hypothetical protein